MRLLCQSKVPRESAHAVAALARRANLHSLALRLLNPIVRPTGKSPFLASDEEKAEYAASLTYLGASEEALGVLREVNASEVPQALLFEAFALFALWRYEDAIPVLKKYLEGSSLNDYQRLVGKVNLSAALVHEKLTDEAEAVLSELRELTGKGKHPLLHGNALELTAQNYIKSHRFPLAEAALDEARATLKSSTGLNEFFVRKWISILRFLRSGMKPSALADLHRIRAEAQSLHWETVRDCDRFEALSTGNPKLLLHVYFGSPFASYRAKLLKEFGAGIEIPDSYHWVLPAEGKKAKPYLLDPESGAGLKPAQLLHRMLLALTSDFYRPLRLAVAHHQLYPDDFFNPTSSPHQVHEAVRRLRNWFTTQKIPLSVEEKSSFYRLVAKKTCVIRVGAQGARSSKLEVFLKQIAKVWPEKAFSREEVVKEMKLSSRTASRLLLEAQRAGLLEKKGLSTLTRYVRKRA